MATGNSGGDGLLGARGSARPSDAGIATAAATDVVGQRAQDPDHAQHAVEVPPHLGAQPSQRHAPDGAQLRQEVGRLHLVLWGQGGGGGGRGRAGGHGGEGGD